MSAVTVMGNPFKPSLGHAAYVGLVLSVVAFGLGLAALAAAVSLGVR